ncbi:M14 family zinc carboxypeptidase [Dietzia sp. SL131]|uniref:M14 family zinc carboxypeptidase n=1 Tax=Dietzia sp. SL131 TaxID=2995149 RepID=UPI00227D5258|nr:M14 family zinc carboxypeptidase [Dietzia sp. SL131]MCY1656360.1 M14 family zinc carboxypeptidase [Dietzia sp. SL131]
MLTRFESTSGEELTTLADEADLYTALAGTGRVTTTLLGLSTNLNLPVRLVTVDLPSTPHDAPCVLFVGMQHGNEPVGRETLLSTIRDFAEATDPASLALLGACRFYFIPTANPGGFPLYRTIPASGGANMNREHLSLSVIESRFVQQAITDLDPALVVDCHEQFGSSPTTLRVEMLPGRHPMSAPVVTEQSLSLHAAVQSALDAQSIEHGPYSVETDDPWVLRSMCGLRNIPFLLVETPALNDTIHKWERFRWYKVVRDAVLAWSGANIATARAAKRAGEAEMVRRGTARDVPFNLNTTVLNPPPLAYTFHGQAPDHLEVFGLDYTDVAGKVTVPMAQAQWALLPFLFDPDGPEPVVAATRVSPTPPPPKVPPFRGRPVAMKVRLDGETHLVTAMKARIGGTIYEVRLPS